MSRGPYTVQVLNRGRWASDVTSKHADVCHRRADDVARSPRRPRPVRVVDRDGRQVTR